MISHLQMITIYVSDLPRAIDFYTQKLGFLQTAEYQDDGQHIVWVVPDPAGRVDLATEIALYAAEKNDTRIGTSSGIVFSANDIEATYNELKAKGVNFTFDLVRHTYGQGAGDQEARFVDPDGNEFLLHT